MRCSSCDGGGRPWPDDGPYAAHDKPWGLGTVFGFAALAIVVITLNVVLWSWLCKVIGGEQ